VFVQPFIIQFAFFYNTVFAASLSSPLYNIEMGSVNIGGGNMTGENIKLNSSLGQPVQGEFESTGTKIKAGFEYLRPRKPFALSVTGTNLNFGTITANTFKSISSNLIVSAGSAAGFTVKVIEDHSLRISNQDSIIADTSCDPSLPCSVGQAAPWIETTSYGFGFNITGDGVDSANFISPDHFQPFPNNELGQDPVTIMSAARAYGKTSSAAISYKINVSPSQLNGLYQNTIQFIALPSF